MKTAVMSDILQRLEQLNEKELIQPLFKEVSKQEEEKAQIVVWPKKYGLASFLKKRRSVCANLFYQKVFNHNLLLGQDVADKGKKF